MTGTSRLPTSMGILPAPAIHAQRGFLMIMAVMLIIVAALLLSVMVYFANTGGISSANNLNSKQALYIAGTGLERGTRALVSPVLAERLACGAVTSDASTTNVAFADGQFTVTGGASDYPAATTLKAGINSADSIIPVNSVAGYDADGGRVLIDREAIDYSAVEPSDTAVCGGATKTPCLVGAQRGQDGSVAALHVSGTPVGQYQCDLQSRGGVPTLASPRGLRTLVEGIQLQEGWAVGNRINGGTSGWRFVRWDGAANPNAWVGQSVTTTGGAQNLLAVSMLGYADGWAVGNVSGGRPVALRWNTPCGGGAGTGVWNNCTANPYVPAINKHLNSVSMLSVTDGWAVGVRIANATNGWTFLRWNNPVANIWNRIVVNTNTPAPGTRATNLNAVYMLSATEGWAVGNTGGGGGPCTNNARILHWSAGVWNCVVSPSNQNLNAVYALASNNAWAVGNSGNGGGGTCTNGNARILNWNGVKWNCVPSPATMNLKAIYMVSATDGWAVGSALSGAGTGWNVVQWNGTAWSAVVVNTGGVGAQDLNAVACTTASDCWAAGNKGLMLHWDSASWSPVTAAGVTQNLRGIALIGHHESPQSAWREVFQ